MALKFLTAKKVGRIHMLKLSLFVRNVLTFYEKLKRFLSLTIVIGPGQRQKSSAFASKTHSFENFVSNRDIAR